MHCRTLLDTYSKAKITDKQKAKKSTLNHHDDSVEKMNKLFRTVIFFSALELVVLLNVIETF